MLLIISKVPRTIPKTNLILNSPHQILIFLHLEITCDPHLTIEIFKLLWSESEEVFGLGLASLSDEAVEAAVMDLDKVLSTKLLKPSW